MHFERQDAFQNVWKYIFFPEKKVCLPYIKFSDWLSETHLFFLFGLMDIKVFTNETCPT